MKRFFILFLNNGNDLSVTKQTMLVSRVWIYFDLPIEFHYFLSKVLMLSPGLHLKESSKCAQQHTVSSWLSNFVVETECESIIVLRNSQASLCFNNIWNLTKYLFSWSSYKINQVQDKIGVFVSIVSTKIPFKGTGKEYIGDDITEIASAVKVYYLFFS